MKMPKWFEDAKWIIRDGAEQVTLTKKQFHRLENMLLGLEDRLRAVQIKLKAKSSGRATTSRALLHLHYDEQAFHSIVKIAQRAKERAKHVRTRGKANDRLATTG